MQKEISGHLWIYRIVHFDNLEFIFKNGIYTADYMDAGRTYVDIGSSEIIETRKNFPVRIENYGFIGDYIPFYFGRQSIMLYNILTGYSGIKKQLPVDIVYICCKLSEVVKHCERFFFTDGQANKQFTEHFSDLYDLLKIDWDVVNSNNFKKTEDDPDRLRRYQAEFLIYKYVPVNCINKIVVYNKKRKIDTEELIAKSQSDLSVEIAKKNVYYFHF